MKVRVVSTASKSKAVQVVRYEYGRRRILKHIGSGKSQEDIVALKQLAREWIKKQSGQGQLFPLLVKNEDTLLFGKYQYLGFRYGLIAETIRSVFDRFDVKEDSFPSAKLFLDLVLARIVEPSSKRSAQKLLSSYFGINYSLTEIYRRILLFPSFKDVVEKKLILFAKQQLGFEFNFVLYDITTLYFETFTQDEFRKTGYSKDNKIGQPQILVGLVVERNGFPLSFSLFEGNTFEGHTLIPVILEFKKKHQIENLTVVADAAMISQKSIATLKEAGLNYIVGARLGNTNLSTIKNISRCLNRTDGATMKLSSSDDFLIGSFSAKRYAKDKHEMEKQLEKANQVLSGKKKTIRNKFLTKESPVIYSLNQKLIDKTELLLGVKGYHTNLHLPEKEIIDRYRDLWRIEKSFRISKHDLEVRPVYHFKQQAIIAHLLICVTALAVLKWLEIITGKPAKHIVNQLKGVTDARMLNLVTNQEALMRSKIPTETVELLTKISPH